MALKTLQFPVAKLVNPQIGLNALGGMSGQQPAPLSMGSKVQFGNPIDIAQKPNPPKPPVPFFPLDPRVANGGNAAALQAPPSQFATGRQPPTTTIPKWEDTYVAYDPTTDPLMGAAAQAGQQQLDAGLMALQQTFGEQRKELEGRMFQGDLAGSGIQEAIYAKQGRAENQQTGQLAAEISAQTMLNQVDIMREGTDRAITLAQNQIDTAFKSGQLSIDEYNAYTNNLQAETDRLRAEEDQKRTAIMDAQAFAPEGGAAYREYMEEHHPGLFSDAELAGVAGGGGATSTGGSPSDGFSTQDIGELGVPLVTIGMRGGGANDQTRPHGSRVTAANGEQYVWDSYNHRWFRA